MNINIDEVKTIIEFCPLIKYYGDPGIENSSGKCCAFRDNDKKLIDVCKMCKALLNSSISSSEALFQNNFINAVSGN